jgi:hypothetical protein
MVFNGYIFNRLLSAKIKYYAIPARCSEFCFSVSFFSGNFATHLMEITQKVYADYGRHENYQLSEGKGEHFVP